MTWTGCGSEHSPDDDVTLPGRAPALPAPKGSHVFLIVLENMSYDQVIGNPQAPFINSLTHLGALATRFYGVTHPSTPNYLAMTGGSTFGVTTNCLDCHVPDTSIVDQLEAAHISWKAYMEGIPGPCFKGNTYGKYAKRHNPFVYYDRIVNNPRRCGMIQPLASLVQDLTHGTLPTYAWLTPNLCNQGHDCPLKNVDLFLTRLVPFVQQALGPHGYLILTWDEGDLGDMSGCCGGSDGGHSPTIVVGPEVKPGLRYGIPLDHFSVLRTIEDSLGLPPLRRAGAPGIQALDPMFRRPPRVR